MSVVTIIMKSGQITIHDLARMLNISASTVSRALNDNPRISSETKQKIKDLAKKLNYQPNVLGSNLRTGKTKTIGVVVPHINRNFFSNVIGGIEETARNAGYKVMITQSGESYEKEAENIRALINARVEGILISLSTETIDFSQLKLVKKSGIPLLFFDRATDKVTSSRVLTDDYEGAFKATEHLISEGFKRIAHFAGPDHVAIYINRKRGYLDALKKHKLKIYKEDLFNNTITHKTGREACSRIFSKKSRPDAVFSASDISALGAFEYLKSNGYKIPDDLALVGFANEPFAGIIDPGLTSVEQQSSEIGKKAAELFLLESSNKDEKKEYETIIIKPELIIRASSIKMHR